MDNNAVGGSGRCFRSDRQLESELLIQVVDERLIANQQVAAVIRVEFRGNGLERDFRPDAASVPKGDGNHSCS